jgi:hypothetical protein
VKAESTAEISHHLTNCSRIILSRALKSKDKEKARATRLGLKDHAFVTILL